MYDEADQELGAVWFDDSTVVPPDEFSCLVLCTNKWKWPARSVQNVMVVVPTSPTGRFERIGVGIIEGDDEPRSELVEVTII